MIELSFEYEIDHYYVLVKVEHLWAFLEILMFVDHWFDPLLFA